MKGFNRNRETRLRTSNKQYGRRDEEESPQKGMLNPDTADRYWRCIFAFIAGILFATRLVHTEAVSSGRATLSQPSNF